MLFIGDAIELLIQTYEPKKVPIRHVMEVKAHEIDHEDPFFDSLRDGYPEFNDWWREKCIKQHRPCWVVYDGGHLAGLIVRKDETACDTDALTPAKKILKICTFKVAPKSRGVKLGELLLKQVLWYAQANGYDLAYLTTYEDQVSLMALLEYYGFRNAGPNANGECIYERGFSSAALIAAKDKATTGLSRQNSFNALILNRFSGFGRIAKKLLYISGLRCFWRPKPVIAEDKSPFNLARKNYPRFIVDEETQGFGIPIKEDYHDTLFPDLSCAETTTCPGNTIRKVYLCRAKSNLGPSGSILFFYKGVSKNPPSQAITALGILESMNLAKSTTELMQMTGGRSVYSAKQLGAWKATSKRPVKVISYLLAAYIDPPVSKNELETMGIINKHPQQSIYKLRHDLMTRLIKRSRLDFAV